MCIYLYDDCSVVDHDHHCHYYSNGNEDNNTFVLYNLGLLLNVIWCCYWFLTPCKERNQFYSYVYSDIVSITSDSEFWNQFQFVIEADSITIVKWVSISTIQSRSKTVTPKGVDLIGLLGDIKEDWGSERRKFSSGVQGWSPGRRSGGLRPPEAEAFLWNYT